MDETASPPLPRRKSRLRRLIFWVIGVPVIVILGLVALGAIYHLLSESVPVTAADRGVLVTATNLAKNTDWFEPAPGVEVITKTRFFDGTYDLEYVYEHPEEDDYVYCYCLVTVNETATEATVGYEAGLAASRAAWALEDTKLDVRDDLFSWGDTSTCGLLTDEGGGVFGTHFTCKTGRLTFEWTVTGMYFDDAKGIADLLRPVLTRLRNYHP